MKNFLKTAAAVQILLCLTLSGFSQKSPIKFGDVPLEHLKMKVYKEDSSASAVVLADYGESFITYSQSQGWKLKYDRHIRIKIINKDGYDWADGQIYLYHDNGNKETISSLKGTTYNLEGGKIVKSKLEKQSIFDEEYDKNRDIKKFSLPNVKEGSVLEYSYSISSDFLRNLQSWEFQKSIPVVWSEYRASIPEYFDYQKIMQGYLAFAVNDNITVSDKILLNYSKRSSNGNITTTSHSNETIDLKRTNFRWVVTNAPAFINEPYMTTRQNYISQVKFELAFIKMPREPIRNIMGTWEKLNEQFLESEYFGSKLNNSGFLKKELELLALDSKSDEQKITSILSHVKSKVKWDGRKTKYLDTNLKEPLDDGKGSSSEINLLLTSMLMKAGIDANPVLISTRDHGMVRKSMPLSSQFNYVICSVKLGDKNLLIDATEEYLSLSVLPERCLNNDGFVISKNNPGWLDIQANSKNSTRIGGEIAISEDGELTGSLKYSYSGYDALKQRKSYFGKGEEVYIADKKANSQWEIEEIELENEEDYAKPFVVKYNAEINEGIESLGNIIYLDPMLSGKYKKNPFTLEKREYPIDFSCPIEELYYTTYILPEGYQLESPIEPFNVSLPGQAGRFIFTITAIGNKLIVMSKLNIKKTRFVMNEYPYIKEFFAQIVSKQNEQLVLKKI
ncbi:MAG: hypothetical protein ACI9GZ_002951 [Bacteroidia bacterium]|jgi:uncharacterized protein YjhX (UPF0386 family)